MRRGFLLALLGLGLWPGTLDAAGWDLRDPQPVTRDGSAGPVPALAVTVDPSQVIEALQGTPLARHRHGTPTRLELPTPSGNRVEFELRESGTLSPQIRTARPGLRTYQGIATDGSHRTMRLTVHADRLHARVPGPEGWIVDSLGSPDPRVVHLWRNADDPSPRQASCGVAEENAAPAPNQKFAATGDELHVYDLAMTGTGEFTVYHGSIANAEAQIATLVNNANATWERDLSIQLQIVDFNLYTDPATDPFHTGTVMNGDLIDQNHDALLAKLGADGFDIGHVVGEYGSAGWQGLAGVGILCDAWRQGLGGTLAATPTAGALLEGILHEAGHQLGASHSFNGTAGNCGPNRTGSWAYEIASGVSIMSYAGSCGAGNVENTRLGFYNVGSMVSIQSEVQSVPSCGTVILTSNTAPVADAGVDLVIPQGTAFVLDGTATDNEGDNLTIAWEQYDLGPAGGASSNTVNGPTFRNFSPGNTTSRHFPQYQAYRLGGSTPFEFLPSVDRTLTFRMVVRDNNGEAGGVDWDTKVLTVTGNPFVVTSPDGGESTPAGEAYPVTWDVGGGGVASDVRVLFSSDRGATWTEVVASTPNDGAESVVLPCVETSLARVRVEPTDNVFFDLSDADFTITPDVAAPVLTCPAPLSVTATGPDGIDADDPALAPWRASATAEDNCDGTLTANYAGPSTIPIGENTIAFTVLDAQNNFAFCTANLTVLEPTAIPTTPTRTAILGIHPNPSNPRATVRFRLSRTQAVRLEILDVRGRRVADLHAGTLGEGEHSLVWDGAEQPSGIYFARLVTEDGEFHRRLARLK